MRNQVAQGWGCDPPLTEIHTHTKTKYCAHMGTRLNSQALDSGLLSEGIILM